ncbi:cupin domain-containing protein [Ruficoccus amylovorans]|uniref:Cupin domain-containing protein n=1 Tax=Ruficoccus amylovorans TaxID=1804625 RepID=A0A842HK45_9BACT|nr:cupin domain-containing protein [Ruficoccus amylovorans]MBC2595531.1 cupin domain-containing protein [Ruficoccus amylovorans]
MNRVYKGDKGEPIHWMRGEEIYELIGRKSSGSTLHSLMRVTIKPGSHSRPHYHPMAEESYYLLEGRARIELDGEVMLLEPGDAALIRPGQHHQIWTVGDEPLVFLIVAAPAWDITDTVFLDE